MDTQRFVIGQNGDLTRMIACVSALAKDGPVSVELKRHKPRRSVDQNALLWSLYTDIIRLGGETMAGWTKDDLHDLFLGEHFGWTEMRIGKHRRKKPARRSSRLSKAEFSDFVDFIVRYMADLGVYLELPGEIAV